MNAMLATIDDRTARKVAEDIRDFGHGYVRIDRDGRAEHVPAHAVTDRTTQPARAGEWVHE